MGEDGDRAPALRAALVDAIAVEAPWVGGSWNARVLEAMRRFPRHRFVPGVSLERAYDDEPQPIGHGQTISQPTVVALMTQALELSGRERVLEIGTGCGYQAAILGELAAEVDTVERIPQLFYEATVRLTAWPNVRAHLGDGYRGLEARAPFDRILLTAAPPELPSALLTQLAEGGILVAPVGTGLQALVRVEKRDGRLLSTRLGTVRFVPMVPADASPARS
ncbi:MAG: protein-L-isoaspartate(D-aspartate) O-methyltransferase [Deltaproteobacteria bacterium]|nr:protein-L-isoaspartate(D-aspartate) O-methyltransferase [Deltaproteobacteria bacterium]